MKTYFDCIPCFVRQALDALRFVTDDENVQEHALREALRLIGGLDLKRTPPEIANDVHAIVRKVSGSDDPYVDAKRKQNETALAFVPELRELVQASDDPLETALRLAIAGNIVDFGFASVVDEERIRGTIERAMEYPFAADSIRRFRHAAMNAEAILYLADNAGEVVFDRLLVEQLPRGRVTVAVKGGPFLNDALMADARMAGLDEVCKVVDNGSRVPGTVLSTCSDEFRQKFEAADLIIAKGQANYETLSEMDAPLWFLLQAKCPVIADDIGVETGTMLILEPRMA